MTTAAVGQLDHVVQSLAVAVCQVEHCAWLEMAYLDIKTRRVRDEQGAAMLSVSD